MGGGIGLGEATTKRLEIEVAERSTIVVETQDLGRLAERSILIHPDGTRELVNSHEKSYRSGSPAINTLQRIPNSQPPQIKSTFYQMASKNPFVVFVEDYSSTHKKGSSNYDVFNEMLLGAGE